MCPGPRNARPHRQPSSSSLLLELAAADDLAAFRRAVHEDSLSLVAASSWYGPSTRGRLLALHLRTPAMVAALYGSTNVLSYVLSIAPSEASRASATDGATPLQLAIAGGAPSAAHLVGASPSDLLPLRPPMATDKKKKKKARDYGPRPEQQQQPADDITGGVFATDEFRMYGFKVKPCSRAYTHDWTECPFAHPGENARRRDPRRFSYTCVPCPEFRRDPASCRSGDACEYAHGVFESWLHPAQYRTRLCKDDLAGCPRRICFFAHGAAQLRAAVSSSFNSLSSPATSHFDMPPQLSSRPALTTSREMGLDLDRYSKHRLPSLRTSPDYSDLIGYVQALSSLEQQQQQQHKPPLAMGSRATAFGSHRSQSFADRGAPGARSSVTTASSVLFSGWGSPDGKPDWGVRGAELRKSTSFGITCWSDLERMVA